MRREQDAYRAAEKAVELDPQRPEGYATLGVLHFLTDRYAQATAALQKAISLAPDNPEPHITLAQVYADEHKYAEARSELAMAREQVAAIPDEHEREALMALAWHSETYLLLAEGKDAEAIACAQEVVALKEANPYAACLAYSNLGIIEIRERHYDQGVEYLERAYQMNPYNHRVAGMLGRVLITRNRFARAAEVLERAVANSPSGSGTIRYFYAMALARTGQREEALAQYRQALQEGLKGRESLVARWQTIWLSQAGRYAVIAMLLVAALAWLLLAKPDPKALTLVSLLAVILILQRMWGRRKR
jgi:tetratricopeptide (TPR) repeat protein